MSVRSEAGRWIWHLALIAFCLHVTWVPAHLAFEAHHGHGPQASAHTHHAPHGHSDGHSDGHSEGHGHDGERGHEPHSASDHTVELARSPVLGTTVVLSRPDASVVALAAAGAARRAHARLVDERPRGRPPDPSGVRGPPAR